MTTLREAAEKALDALIAATPVKAKDPQIQADAIVALREALAQPDDHIEDHLEMVQPAPEPVAWMDRDGDIYPMPETEGWRPPHTLLYTHPPQRKPLTDEEITKLTADTWGSASIAPQSAPAFARAIERAHGIGGEE